MFQSRWSIFLVLPLLRIPSLSLVKELRMKTLLKYQPLINLLSRDDWCSYYFLLSDCLREIHKSLSLCRLTAWPYRFDCYNSRVCVQTYPPRTFKKKMLTFITLCPVFPPVASIQRLPAVSVMTDINFPMKGRKGMVDWARNSEDKVVVPKGIFLPQTAGTHPRRNPAFFF